MRKKIYHRRGAALIVVLASLIFLAALVLAFLASVNTELKSSKAYSSGANAKLLAQTSVSLAMAQISDATSGTNSAGETVAWASQPGMIRTYDDKGDAAGYYKLFSWTDMSGAGGYDATLGANSVPNDWNNQKAVFTDLNQPMRVPDGSTNRLVYPIIDGNNLTDFNGNRTYVTNGAAAVDGFYVAKDAVTTATTNAVPMPVKWLYVLEDGKIAAGSPSGSTEVAIAGASDSNQIVGRVAFWTDDESCKININTASEGTYADMPRANYYNPVEKKLTLNQPVQGEYQRYPGHPATTSLSVVLKKLSSTMNDDDWAEKIYDIVPKIQTGGSREGGLLTTQGSSPKPISPDSDRLFSNVDEMVFSPSLVGGARELNDAQVLNSDTLARDRFFLTAYSRAPDVNLFNKPRVSIWPIFKDEENSHMTAFDRLMAFCGKVNSHIYYFQRSDPVSPTVDLPSASSTGGLGRNRGLLEYLRTLTASKIPGFGGDFAAKYGKDSDQILTQIFDYIRCTNLADSSITNPQKRFTVAVGASVSPAKSPGLGQVIPIEDSVTGTRGFGRFRTVQGASLHFIANADGDDPASQLDSTGNTLAAANMVPAGKVRVQVMFLLQLFDPSVGSVFDNPNFKWSVTGLNGLQWGPVGGPYANMNFQGDAATYVINDYPMDGAYYGDQLGIKQLLVVTGSKYTSTADFPKDKLLEFRGDDVTITLMNQEATGKVVQTVVLNIPSGSFPLPQLGQKTVTNHDGTAFTNMRYFTTRISRATDKDRAGAWVMPQDVIRSVGPVSGDVRLIAARKTPSKSTEPDYQFAPINPAKWNSNIAQVMGMHTLWSGAAEPFYGARLGSLVPNVNYESPSSLTDEGYNKNGVVDRISTGLGVSPASDSPLNGVAVGKSTAYSSGDLLGDFDNGPGLVRDGPFINKADEGSQGDKNDPNKMPYDWGRGLSGNILNDPTLFTPNRLISSAVTFGSLPTGVWSNRPWQTLLFHSDPTNLHPGNKGRAGNGSVSVGMPSDHLLLDLFNMPIVEPYAISEPLSTAGRVNMNYQIIPFTYINRDTGVRAVLKSEKVVAINDSDALKYKLKSITSTPLSIRLEIDMDETLKGFQQRFASKDIFRSATEICELPIVPVGSTAAGMASFWNNHRLTGDNSRERPYATIYPRLTTKSNTYTIYYRVQSLKKVKRGNAGVWDETKDKVVGETRGYQTIERYIDPNNPNIPDYVSASATQPISSFYKFRVLQSKQFAP